MGENQIAAANYMLSFFNDVMLITEDYGRYLIQLHELSAKYEVKAEEINNEIKKKTIALEEEEVINIRNLTHTIRFRTTKLKIQYISITKKLMLTKSEDVIRLSDSIINNYTSETCDIEKLCQQYNNFLVDTVIQDLISASSSMMR